MSQEPEDEYGYIPQTFVYINEAYRELCASCVDYRVMPATKAKEFTMSNGTTYIPIQLSLSAAPASDLAISFSIDYEDPALPQLASYVQIQPTSLSFVPWKYTDKFNVTVNNWDFAKGTKFYVNYKFTGTDAPAYKTNSNNQLTFTVTQPSAYVSNPIVEVVSDSVDVKKHSFGGAVARGSGEGYIHALVLPKDVAPPKIGLTLVSWAVSHPTGGNTMRELQNDNTTGG